MQNVYTTDLTKTGGANKFTIGQTVRISPFATLMRDELATIMGASLGVDGRICVKGQNGTLGHYTPTMLTGV